MTNTISAGTFTAKDPAETIYLTFDFSALATEVSAPDVTIARIRGTDDPTPESVLSGSPSASGGKVVQTVTGGVVGTDYLIRCQVDTIDGQRFVLAGTLPVRTA